MKMKNYTAIDIAKYVSALLVVCIHTFPLYDLSQTANMVWIQAVCRIAVPFFLCCIRLLVLSKDRSMQRDERNGQCSAIKTLFTSFSCSIWCLDDSVSSLYFSAVALRRVFTELFGTVDL